MEVLSRLEDIKSSSSTALAIGKFDGVHLGHKKLLKVITGAREDGLLSCVFTFEPSPERLFKNETKQLSTREERRRELEALGVELLVEYPLDAQSASVDPAVFIEEYLCGRLKAALIAAGPDISYGAGGKGDMALLNSMKRTLGYETVFVDKLVIGGTAVSSSRIRDGVSGGRMEEAALLLGHPYTIRGTVVKGAALGRSIGFPTINLMPEEDKLLPPNGVYRSIVCIRGKSYKGLTNIGTKPTVSGSDTVSAETFIFDFDEDVYGEEALIGLTAFRRPEKRFGSVEELKAQLARDIAAER